MKNDCGCEVAVFNFPSDEEGKPDTNVYRVIYCPVHEAAHEVLQMLDKFVERCRMNNRFTDLTATADSIIARTRGKKATDWISRPYGDGGGRHIVFEPTDHDSEIIIGVVHREERLNLVLSAPNMLHVLQTDVIALANLAMMVDEKQAEQYMESVYDIIRMAKGVHDG